MVDAYDMSDVDDMCVAHVCVLFMNVLLCMKKSFVWILDPWFGLNGIYEYAS